jgi:hypothetical protein
MRDARSFTMTGFCTSGLIAAAMAATALTPLPARADTVLSGTIKSAAGEALGGVTVSARQDGANIVTTVRRERKLLFPATGRWPI